MSDDSVRVPLHDEFDASTKVGRDQPWKVRASELNSAFGRIFLDSNFRQMMDGNSFEITYVGN